MDEIRSVVKSELFPIIEELKEIDPHELIKSVGYFESNNQARGLVWAMFIKKALYKM